MVGTGLVGGDVEGEIDILRRHRFPVAPGRVGVELEPDREKGGVVPPVDLLQPVVIHPAVRGDDRIPLLIDIAPGIRQQGMVFPRVLIVLGQGGIHHARDGGGHAVPGEPGHVRGRESRPHLSDIQGGGGVAPPAHPAARAARQQHGAYEKKAGRQAGRSPPRGSSISCSLWCLHRLSACPLLQVGFGLGHLPPSGPDQYGYCILLPKPSGVTQLS